MKVDKVLLVGFGSIGKRHLSNIKKLQPQLKLAVLRSRCGEEPIVGCDVVSGLEAALAFQPKAAFICNPSSFHLSIATELAKVGVHLFIEKPLTNNSEGLEEFIRVVHSAKIRAMVGYNLRFSQSLCALKGLVQCREYGRALHVIAEVGQYLPDWRPENDYRTTVSARSKMGGGALLELSHELDYLSWIFGEPVKVSGQLLKVSDLEIDVEDLVLANICFEKAHQKINSSIHLDLLQRKPYRSCKVICEKATLVWDAIEDCVKVHQKEGVTTVFQGDKERNHTYEQELLQFMSCIETGSASPISVEEGQRVIRLVEALRVSSETDSVVYL